VDILSGERFSSRVHTKKPRLFGMINQLPCFLLIKQRPWKQRGKRDGFIRLDNTFDEWDATNALEGELHFTPEHGINNCIAVEVIFSDM